MRNKERGRQAKKIGKQTYKYTNRMTGEKKGCNMTQKSTHIF